MKTPRITLPTGPSNGIESETATQPWRRHPIRLALGKRYYIARRHLAWRSGRYRWARPQPDLLEVVQTSHATPLRRQLSSADEQTHQGKVNNLSLAAAKLDGTRLEPGQTFSYWRLIGPTTARRGYKPGMILSYGEVISGVGGGLCQLSNLIYWMTLHTPLTVTELHRHGYDVFPDAGRTQPFGSGATCFYNYGDLMIRNDTDRPFQLHVWLSADELLGEWRSNQAPQQTYQVFEAEHIFRQEAWGGYSRHNLIHRHVHQADGTPLADEFVAENHALVMYSPLLPGTQTPTDAPNSTDPADRTDAPNSTDPADRTDAPNGTAGDI